MKTWNFFILKRLFTTQHLVGAVFVRKKEYQELGNFSSALKQRRKGGGGKVL